MQAMEIRFYASHTKTMLPTRKCVPRSSRQSDHTQTDVVWTFLPFIRSGQIYLVMHSEVRKKTRQVEKEAESNIREWTGLEFAKFRRAVENRENGGNRL